MNTRRHSASVCDGASVNALCYFMYAFAALPSPVVLKGHFLLWACVAYCSLSGISSSYIVMFKN